VATGSSSPILYSFVDYSCCERGLGTSLPAHLPAWPPIQAGPCRQMNLSDWRCRDVAGWRLARTPSAFTLPSRRRRRCSIRHHWLARFTFSCSKQYSCPEKAHGRTCAYSRHAVSQRCALQHTCCWRALLALYAFFLPAYLPATTALPAISPGNRRCAAAFARGSALWRDRGTAERARRAVAFGSGLVGRRHPHACHSRRAWARCVPCLFCPRCRCHSLPFLYGSLRQHRAPVPPLVTRLLRGGTFGTMPSLRSALRGW